MNLSVGTSGFSYKEWKGSFYPERIPADEMLHYYAERLPAVEIDNTFYRLPRASVLSSWAEQVPEDFRFALKASRRITHFKRLKDAGDETSYLLRTVESLGSKLGAILFQLPPNLPKDRERLERFLDLIPDAAPAAFEFRHASWFDEEIFELLRQRGRPLCIVDNDEEPVVPFVATTAWGYIRLRRPEYADADLEQWKQKIASTSWDRALVFFKHEDAGVGPALAARFLGKAPVLPAAAAPEARKGPRPSPATPVRKKQKRA